MDGKLILKSENAPKDWQQMSMDVSSSIWHRRLNGTVEIRPLDLAEGLPEFSARAVSRSRYTWRPPYQLKALPESYELALDCYTHANGVRRFTLPKWSADQVKANPEGRENTSNPNDFAFTASIGGYDLLLDRGDLPKDLLLGGHQSRLYLQLSKHLREYYDNRKSLELGLVKSQTATSKRRNILPEGFGLGPTGEGEKWGQAEFKATGRAAARRAGIRRPDKAQIQSYAFFEAAKANPLNIESDSEIVALVRSVLFALPDSTDPLPDDRLRAVAFHVRKSLKALQENPEKESLTWIKNASDLLHNIEQRLKLPREQVKRALLELGWHSFHVIGKCIDAQMRAFRDAIPVPLTLIERNHFDDLFLASPDFGGLPLLLLFDRYAELGPALVHVSKNVGDLKAISVLHRMMAYYSEAFGNRRKADREYKRAALLRNVDGKVAVKASIEFEQLVRSSIDEDILLQIAKYIGHKQGIDCDFGEWEANVKTVNDTLQIELRRAEPTFVRSFTVSRAEIEGILQKIQRDW